MIEHFESPYSRTRATRLAFTLGKASFRTTWKTERGPIVLMVQCALNKVVTAIVYADAVNTALNYAEIENDL